MAKFLLDSADIEEVKKWRPYVVGMTTNPILLGKVDSTAQEIYDQLIELEYREDFLFFNQITDKDSFINEATNGPTVVYKVPLVKEQYQHLWELRGNLPILNICGTMTYDIIQLQTAINFGADYCIILLHKNDDDSFVYRARGLKEIIGSNIKLIGASFRNKEEVEFAIEEGMDYVSVPPHVLDMCYDCPQAQEEFDKIYT